MPDLNERADAVMTAAKDGVEAQGYRDVFARQDSCHRVGGPD
jgi:hypothetical protein